MSDGACCHYCRRYTCECDPEINAIMSNSESSMSDTANRPTKPGFYWALWLTASDGTHEGDQLTPESDWGIVEVWENFIGEPCEADRCEKFGVSVPGVREAQWLENFKWGGGPIER